MSLAFDKGYYRLLEIKKKVQYNMKVLVTGGLGFIGSHTCVQLLEGGHEVLILDNLSNSYSGTFDAIKYLHNGDISLGKTNILNLLELRTVAKKFRPDAIMHFAGLKSTSESLQVPLDYYETNVIGTWNLLKICAEFFVTKFIFSSSATVYGVPTDLPIDENHKISPITPYGHTKAVCEQLISDFCKSKKLDAYVLRYFNPVGAHHSGLIGENPLQEPNNLMPILSQVASGKLKKVSVFGTDYETSDGSAERDYIHVSDLASAHLAALHANKLPEQYNVFNVGTGKSTSVFDLIRAYEQSCGVVLPIEKVARRDGDVAQCWTDITKISQQLEWSPKFDLDDMCKSSWRYVVKNQRIS